jgi:outer membrane protein assembly factor BamB
MSNGNDGTFQDEARHQTPAKTKDPIPAGATDGDILWLTDLVAEVGIYNHDTSYCSPLIVGDFIYVNTSNGVDMTHKKIRKPDAPSLVVLEKKTGRIVAKDVERMGPQVIHATWSSPAIGKVGGKDVIYFGGGNGIFYGFEALAEMPPAGTVADLKCIWRYDGDPNGPKEKGVDHEFTSNRETSPCNIVSNPVLANGKVYLAVGGDFWWGKNQAWLKCLDPEKLATGGAEVWSYPMKKCITTPAVGKEITVVGDTGNHEIVCLDSATGTVLWKHKTKGDLWAPALIADGKIYMGTMGGELFIFEAAKEKKLLCETRLDAPVGSSVVAANGVLYVTTHKTLWALTK